MNAVPGISVVTTAMITDFAELGRTIAGACSDEQARFFLGMADGFDSFAGSMQLQYVKDEVGKFDLVAQVQLAAFINKLNDYLDAVTA